MQTFLHIGCGACPKEHTTRAFAGKDWRELRLDINPDVKPDIVGSMLDMAAAADASVDAVFSSHSLEHLFAHEVPRALAEFRRVLKPEGFAVITCPDLQSVAALVAQDKLTATAYVSPAGPIAPLDMIFGHRPALARGEVHMAHRCGFTKSVLVRTLRAAGFLGVAAMGRPAPSFDLWAVASMSARDEAAMRALAAAHFPAQPGRERPPVQAD